MKQSPGPRTGARTARATGTPRSGRSVATRAVFKRSLCAGSSRRPPRHRRDVCVGASLSLVEFPIGRHIDLTGDSLTREQFLLSQLLLSGAASHDVVDIIYDRYRTINTDNDDAITREEFLHHVEKSSPPKAPTPAHVKLARSLSSRLTSG